MNFDVLLSASRPIPVHALLAIFAVAAGGVQFALPKGTIGHRSLGYLWVTAMFLVAVSSFFISEFRWIGPFGPIHILSVFVLWSLWKGLFHARRHDIGAHQNSMFQLYVYSLLVAAAFTFVPGRIMYKVLFS